MQTTKEGAPTTLTRSDAGLVAQDLMMRLAFGLDERADFARAAVGSAIDTNPIRGLRNNSIQFPISGPIRHSFSNRGTTHPQ